MIINTLGLVVQPGGQIVNSKHCQGH